jgi:hypothetical protein
VRPGRRGARGRRGGGPRLARAGRAHARVELAYLLQPGGGSFEVFLDGVRAARLSSRARASATGSAWQALVPAGRPARSLEVRLAGDGEVRLFGASFEQLSPGLVYDALGVNGAKASSLLEWDEAHLSEQLAHRAPDLVVLAFGTNETGERVAPEAWARQLGAVLERVAKAAPGASCLVLGPPDRAAPGPRGWRSMPAVGQVVAAQRRAAVEAGCAYFSQLDAMGGEGSMAAWALESPPRATRDRVPSRARATRSSARPSARRCVAGLRRVARRRRGGAGGAKAAACQEQALRSRLP